MIRKNVLIIDVGTKFIKYSLFHSDDGKLNLLKFDIKTVVDLNQNLLKRDLERRISLYEEKYKINEIILVPLRILSQNYLQPKLEFFENKKQFREQVKNIFKTNLQTIGHVYDWSVMKEVPEEDYRSIFVDSIPDKENNMYTSIMVELGVKNFKIASPLYCYNRIHNSNKPYMVIDIGENYTSIAIVQESVLQVYEVITIGAASVTKALIEEGYSTSEATKLKHESELNELPNGVNEFLEELRERVESIKNDYHDQVKEYFVIGGSAALEIEEDLNESTVGMERIYPKLELMNDRVIPRESRNYLYGSYSVMQNYMNISEEQFIDFSASKSGNIGLKIKSINSIYNKYRVLAIAITIAFAGVSGGYSVFSNHLNKYDQELAGKVTMLENQVTDSQEQIDLLSGQIEEMLSEEFGKTEVPVWTILDSIREVTPVRTRIKEFGYIGDSENAYIKIISDSQKTLGEFSTLLGTIYNEVKVEKLEVLESETGTLYQNDILLTGVIKNETQ